MERVWRGGARAQNNPTTIYEVTANGDWVMIKILPNHKEAVLKYHSLKKENPTKRYLLK